VKHFTKIIVIALILLFSFNSLFALEKKSTVRKLIPGTVTEGKLELSVKNYETFTFQVKPDTYAVEIDLSGAPADLDMFIKYGEKIENYDDVDYAASTDSYNEKIVLTRLSEPILSDGTYFIDVAYQRDVFPAVKHRRVTAVPFKIEEKERKVNIEAVLKPSETVSGVLYPEKGMAAVYAFNIPKRTQFFRVDISDTISDIDLLVGYEKKIVTLKNYDYIGESLLGKESLIIRNSDKGFLPPGMYYITVFDQVASDYKEKFTITAGLKSLPPPALSRISNLPPPQDEQENALFATVEVIAEAGKGSGCLVSRDGYILTNWHVVKNFNEQASGNIYIAVNRSYNEPPEELFKARLVDYNPDSDLALLKIESGLYGQPLPFSIDFSYFPIGKSSSVKIGQPISILGYPGVGGTGSRASVSLTTGIVSGFETTEMGTYIKTDTEINGGSSGGAVIDVYFNLVGIPTVIIGEDSSQIGYITPVSAIPVQWYRYFTR